MKAVKQDFECFLICILAFRDNHNVSVDIRIRSRLFGCQLMRVFFNDQQQEITLGPGDSHVEVRVKVLGSKELKPTDHV